MVKTIAEVDVNLKLNVDATRELASDVFAACGKYDANCADNDVVVYASMAPMRQWAQDMINICDKFELETATQKIQTKGGKNADAK